MEDPEQNEIASPWEAPSKEAFQKPLPAQEVKTVVWNGKTTPRTMQEYLADLTHAYQTDGPAWASKDVPVPESPAGQGPSTSSLSAVDHPRFVGAPAKGEGGGSGRGFALPRFPRSTPSVPTHATRPARAPRPERRMALLAHHLANATAIQSEIAQLASAFRADPAGPPAEARLRRIHTLSRAFHRSARQSGSHAWRFGKLGSPQTAAVGLDHIQRLNALTRASLEGVPDQKKILERIRERIAALQRIILGLLTRLAPRKVAAGVRARDSAPETFMLPPPRP